KERSGMGRPRSVWLLIVSLVALAQIGTSVPATSHQGPDPSVGAASLAATRWLSGARAVQAATHAHLQVTDQPVCADASFVSYRRSDLQPGIADQWYVASQLLADVELLRA